MGLNFKRIIAGGIFLGVVCAFGFQGVQLTLFVLSPLHFTPRTEKSGAPDGAIVEIPKGGVRPHEITAQLIAEGALKPADEENFILLGRFGRFWKRIKAGEYKITPQMTPSQAFTTLISGISIAHPVTVREGENVYEIAADLDSKGLAKKGTVLKLCHDPKFLRTLKNWDPSVKSLEGYLFPDTYFFNKTMSAEEMLHEMYRHFLSVWTPQWTARAKEIGMTRYEVLTLASMIEKETGAPSERPLISSVFHNRLARKMRLQSDPTTIYGIWDRFDGNLHKADLTSDTPYNTYTVPALPLGPIANPGKASIQAALYPATTTYLYFVSHNDGTHEFSTTYEDHLSAVRKFQLDPKAREGKSWRDLARKTRENPASPASPASPLSPTSPASPAQSPAHP